MTIDPQLVQWLEDPNPVTEPEWAQALTMAVGSGISLRGAARVLRIPQVKAMELYTRGRELVEETENLASALEAEYFGDTPTSPEDAPTFPNIRDTIRDDQCKELYTAVQRAIGLAELRALVVEDGWQKLQSQFHATTPLTRATRLEEGLDEL